MAEKEGKKTKSGGKGFYRFSGLHDFLKPNAESKPKQKKELYRYSPRQLLSPKTAETPCSPSKCADREPRNPEGMLSPKKTRRHVDHRHRHTDLEARYERRSCQSPVGQLPKLPKKTRRRSAGTSPERIQSPIKSPLLSPPSPGKPLKKISNCDEKIHLQDRANRILSPKMKAAAASTPIHLGNDHKAARPKAGCTPMSPRSIIQSPVSISPPRQPATHAGEGNPGKISPVTKRGQIRQDTELEGTGPMSASGIVEDSLPELQNNQKPEDNQKELCGGIYSDLPCILFSLLLAAIATSLLVGQMTAGSFKETTSNDRVSEDDDDSNRPVVLVGGGRSLSFPTRTAGARNIRTHVCVYHGSQEGLTYEEDGMAYSASTMPLDSCNLVLYCCAQLSDGYSPGQQPVGNFKKLRNVTASIRPWQRPMLIIGDSADDEFGRFRDILQDRHAKETFVAATTKWCRSQGYAGVFLQWPHGPRFSLDDVVPVMVELQQLFLARSLTLGTVVPQDETEANWMHLHRLAGALGEASIILKPPVYTSRHFTHWTFSYYTRGLLEKLNATAQKMGSARRSLCFMAPAEAVAFTVSSSVVPENLEHVPALGPAISTGHSPAGHRSYTEACSAMANMTIRASSRAVLAIGNGLWLSFTTRDSLGHFLGEVRTLGYTCGGIWDSERDDFTGVCDSEPYPLMAASKAEFFESPARVAMKQP